MAKTQNQIKANNSLVFFGLAAAIILISFLLLSPRVSSALFPFRRAMVWDNFISTARSTNNIDPQKFWEFREFYSPGYFELKTTGLDNNTVQEALSLIDVPIKRQAINLPFDKFTSSRVTSLDSLTTQKTLIDILEKDIPQSDVLLRTNTGIIYKEGKSIKIVFVKPENEMKKAVGFFEYDGKDKEVTKGKYWLNITSVRQD
jgi:hypothetical protein